MPAESQYLHFEHLTKTFPGVRALTDVTFGVSQGSVHALMGENGAGKSTLLKILSGVYQPDSGQVSVAGSPRVFRSTSEAIGAGVAVIYQELHLVPHLSVAENLFLGHFPARVGWVSRVRLLEMARERLLQLGETIDPRTKVGKLPLGQRQMVEIAKALAREARVLAFDEPTSSLSSRETDRLFAVIEQLRRQGKVVLYVSHRMEEIYRICDSATILRDGKHAETFESLANVTRDTIVRKMVGRSISDIYGYRARSVGDVLLEVNGMEGTALPKPASFNVRAGEVLGFFGLVGAGRSELMRLIYGADARQGGKVRIAGQDVQISSPADAIAHGLVFCPEDRKKDGIVPVRSVSENINLSGRRHFSIWRTFIRPRKEKKVANAYVKQLAIRTPGVNQQIRHLSGGNQQKVILARWLCESPKVILLDEPTRGIDIGAKSEIYSIIFDLARQGTAVVVVSSELPELLGICDRIIVMREGEISAEFDRSEADEHRILSAALPIADDMLDDETKREDEAKRNNEAKRSIVDERIDPPCIA